jgi:hypothetical protein
MTRVLEQHVSDSEFHPEQLCADHSLQMSPLAADGAFSMAVNITIGSPFADDDAHVSPTSNVVAVEAQRCLREDIQSAAAANSAQ